ncbi:hypothetical protein DES53_11219 [Roseimicrobium gellanilyticum]|uniref:Uncharacterized protein n=1 Tax=Roseimicrobium gellanilyticum TaxID=748857 RepID=A0A366H773_9BACT|nr:hypothetical protein [Roseimicrobium gellanilyticum]RBP38021.1 hypothetical protein DES53_11219 [Roseimicrobium gellanilyticum]
MNSPVTTTIFILVAIAVVFLIIRRQEASGRSMLDAWAKDEGILLVSAKRCGFWRGPFWLADQGKAVFRIAVTDKESGTLRQGWACCGTFITSGMEVKVVVKWDS